MAGRIRRFPSVGMNRMISLIASRPALFFLIGCMGFLQMAVAADWPTYRHDIERTLFWLCQNGVIRENPCPQIGRRACSSVASFMLLCGMLMKIMWQR